MSNLFLGFPVPRAKIADMIAGSAPPSLHHLQHQNGGTDEIDATGLTGAGGMASVYDDLGLFFDNWFLSLDGYKQYVSGSGGLLTSSGYLQLSTGTTVSSTARLYLSARYTIVPYSYNKRIRLKTRVNFYSATDNLGTMYIGSGLPETDQHIGFYVVNGVLKGTVGDGGAETTVNLETLGAGTFNLTRLLEIIFTPGSKAEFYVNGIKLGEITTGLPTGDYPTNDFVWIEAKNGANAKLIRMILSQYRLYQDP